MTLGCFGSVGLYRFYEIRVRQASRALQDLGGFGVLGGSSCCSSRSESLLFTGVVVKIMAPFLGTLNIRCRTIIRT